MTVEKAHAVAVLREHWPHPVFGCECMQTDDETGVTEVLDVSWEQHVAELISSSGRCDKRGPGGECVREHESCPDFPIPPGQCAHVWVTDRVGDNVDRCVNCGQERPL